MTAKSPFLHDTQFQYAWDSTSLGYLKSCPRKYYYFMLCGYRAKGESVHLRFGQLYHSGLERYDIQRANGADHAIALREVTRYLLLETWDSEAASPWDTQHDKKTRDTLLRSVIWYLEQYKDDACHTVILNNGRPAVELSFIFDTGIPTPYGESFLLSGHLDRLVEFGGDHYVMDRKTTSGGIGQYYFDGYNPDNQMSLYSLASKVVFNFPVSGVIIDAAQILVKGTQFGRGITLRTPDQLDEWLDNFEVWMGQVHYFYESQKWPMNESSCNDYGGCAFRKVCSKSALVRENFLKTDFEINRWNPLEAR